MDKNESVRNVNLKDMFSDSVGHFSHSIMLYPSSSDVAIITTVTKELK